VPVVAEVATLKFKLDADALPLTRIDLPLGLAVGIPSLDGLNVITQFTSHHSEEEDNALLVDRLVTEAPEIERVPVSRTIAELPVPMISCGRRVAARMRV
jgi:hypothetical protein